MKEFRLLTIKRERKKERERERERKRERRGSTPISVLFVKP